MAVKQRTQGGSHAEDMGTAATPNGQTPLVYFFFPCICPRAASPAPTCKADGNAALRAAESCPKPVRARGACLVKLSSRQTSPYLCCDYFLPLCCIPQIATFLLEIPLLNSFRLGIWEDVGAGWAQRPTCTCSPPV